jgi:hypothetical protein
MLTTKQALSVELERMVDNTSLASVLDALATIAAEKADHIDSNWQDAGLARVWRMSSIAIGAAYRRVSSLLGE